MNEAREKAIRQVKKLLALADKNSHEGEMTSAMEKAKAIMMEYDLSLTDVEIKEMEASLKADDIKTVFRRNCVPWERTLGSAVAKLFDCMDYRHGSGRTNPKNGRWEPCFCVAFIGVAPDPQIATEAYEALHETLLNMGRRSEFRGSNQGAYLLGVAQRLRERAIDIVHKQRAAAGMTLSSQAAPLDPSIPVPPNNCTALVIVKEKIIKEAAEKKGFRSITSGKMGGSSGAYHTGRIHGNNVNLNFRKTLE